MSSQKSAFSVWKVIRWVVLATVVIILVLILKKPSPVAGPMQPAVAKQKAEEFQLKMQDLETSHQRGETAEARFDADQINAAFQQSAMPAAGTSEGTATPVAAAPISAPEAAPEVTTVQLAFVDDRATGQFLTNVYGKDVYLTIAGRIGVANGYATFEFTEAKVGDMPVPISLLNPRLQEKLQEPENREKLKLPDYITDLRIENGQLVVVEK